MIGKIEITKLKEHPRNNYYFSELDGKKYEEIKRSIAENGIRNPIKCTTSFTVISGHQRLRIAKELGMETVPVQIIDVDEREAEYLLIAENVERRGQAETDPIKKSRIANFLKEYWGIQRGGDRKSNFDNQSLKNTSDIAQTIGESEWNTHQIMKLNDLIPELQELVSEGRLGKTVGEQLAHLTEDNQRALLQVLGEEIEKTTVAKAKEYRAVENDNDSAEDYAKKIMELEQAKVEAERKAKAALEKQAELEQELEEERNKEPKIIYKVDEKRLEELNKKIREQDAKIEELENEKLEIEEKLKKAIEQTKDYKELRAELEEKKNELAALTQEQIRLKNRRIIYNHASKVTQDIGKTMNQIRLMIHERGDVAGDKEVYNTLNALIKVLREAIEEIESWLEIDVITDGNLVKDSGGEIIDLGEGEVEEVEII